VEEDAGAAHGGHGPAAASSTRKVAILVADGVELGALKPSSRRWTGRRAVQGGRAAPGHGGHLVGPADGGGPHFTNMPSVMFDAVLVPGGSDSAATLGGMGEAVHFVLEAYKHCKTICTVGDGVQLLSTLGRCWP
jgi:catalase